jgi:hypothetical protein
VAQTSVDSVRAIDPPQFDSVKTIDYSWFDHKNPDYERVFRDRLARLTYLRAHPELWEPLKKFYAEDCIAFINDWGSTYDPRNTERNLPTTTPFILFKRQEEFIEWLYARWSNSENGLAEKSRDSGMSWLAVGFAVWMWLYRDGSAIGFGSRKEVYVDDPGNPNSLFWKVRKFIALLPRELRPLGYVEKTHAPSMKVLSPENGSSIIGEAGDNIGRGGRASLYIVDEAAFVEHAETVDAALSQTTNCQIDISTPNGAGNVFHRKRTGGKVPVFTFSWRDDPRKGEEWYAKQKATLDTIVVAQEVDINYEASVDNVMFPGALVDGAQGTLKTAVSMEGPRFLGVDVARFGSAESVLCDRKHRALVRQAPFKGLDTQDLCGEIRAHVMANGGIEAYGAICIDDIGVGGGVTDTLRRWWPKKVVGVNVAKRVQDGLNFNLRAKLTADCKAWMEDGPVHLPRDPELKTQLCGIKYSFRSGLRLIQSKEDMVADGFKSPDRADALFLTFASPPIEESKIPKGPGWTPHDRGAGY